MGRDIRYTRKTQRKRVPLHSLLISTEGKTDVAYLQALCKDKKVIAKIIITESSSIDSLVEYQQKNLNKTYHQKWAICHNKNYSKKQLDEINKKAKELGICVTLSNYSFELWILLHFQILTKPITSIDLTTLLKNIFQEEFGLDYHSSHRDIYHLIIGRQSNAIENAKLLLHAQKELDLSINYPITTFYELIESLENREILYDCSIGSLSIKKEVKANEGSKPLISLTQQSIISFFLEKIQNKDERLQSSTQELADALDVTTSTITKHRKELIANVRLKQIPEGKNRRYKLLEPYACMKEKYFIYINHQLIGYLGFTKGMYQFAYTNQYLMDNFSEEISTEFDLRTKVYYQAKIFPFFEALLPEGVDREMLEKKCGTATHFYLFKYLDFDSMDIIMSKIELKFQEQDRSNYLPYTKAKIEILGGKQKFPNLIPFPISIDKKKIFPPERLTPHELRTLDIKPMSLSGFQHKLKVMIDDEKEIIRELEKDENAIHFMKPYHKEKADPSNKNYFPHLAINEHLFMTFAKNELGFDVPMSAICKNEQDDEYHYVIQYFNRYKGYRYFMDEVSTIMGLDSEDKYNTTAEKMFTEIEKVIRKDDEKLELLNYFFYSMIISHEDMHTKNLSIILDKGEYYASPLYDIATTKIYINSYGYDSHLTVNGKQTKIRLNDFLKLADILKLDRDIVKESFLHILQTFTSKLEEYILALKELGEIPFFIKTKPTASGEKSKIKDEKEFVNILLDYHKKRLQELIELGYFEQLKIVLPD